MNTIDPSGRAMELLAESRPFAGLSPANLRTLGSYLVSITVDAGNTLLLEGDEGSFMALVAEGELDVVKISGDGDEVIVATLKPGWIIGEMAIVDGERRSATIRATCESKLVVLTREDFERMKDTQPRLSITLLAEIARGLSLKLRRMSDFVADVHQQ